MLPKTKKGGILLEDLFEDIEMIISERMGKPIKKLELNEEYKRSNKKFNDKFEEMYQEIDKKMGNNRKREFEDLMFECRTIEEYKQNLYFLVGFLDGIKFFNMLHKIV